MTNSNEAREWIIRRCINVWTNKNQYEDWPGYCENPMTFEEMKNALKECNDKWGLSHDYEFSGHNIKNCKCHPK